MANRPVTMITEAPAGTGKTCVRAVYFLLDEFLPLETGTHWSNFPLGEVPETHDVPPQFSGETFCDRITTAVVERYKMDPQEVLNRVQLIPKDVEASWRLDVEQGGSGPWEFFHDKDLTGVHIALDEGHTMCGKHHSREHKKQWMNFLGELRHRGATIEFLTQDAGKLAAEITREAGGLYTLVGCDAKRDVWCGIRLSDWYQAKAKYLTGRYVAVVWRIESTKQKGRWVHAEEGDRRFELLPEAFGYYDSFDRPKSGGLASAGRPKMEWERLGRIAFAWWFFRRNEWELLSRFVIVSIGAWLLFGGGIGMGMRWAMRLMDKDGIIAKAELAEQAAKQKQGGAAGPGPKTVTPPTTPADAAGTIKRDTAAGPEPPRVKPLDQFEELAADVAGFVGSDVVGVDGDVLNDKVGRSGTRSVDVFGRVFTLKECAKLRGRRTDGGDLPGAPAAAGDAAGGTKPASDAGRGGDASGVAVPGARTPLRDFHRVVRRPRSEADHAGGVRPKSDGSAQPDSSQAGGGSVGQSGAVLPRPTQAAGSGGSGPQGATPQP